MSKYKVRLIDDGSLYTVWQSKHINNEWVRHIIIGEHLRILDAYKLHDTLTEGITGIEKEGIC